jgi:uncharacterized membrane protein YfcA
MDVALILLALAAVSLIYATVGQAGGTGFLAVMAVAGMAADELRPTALLLNVLAAGYATWRLHVAKSIDWRMLACLALPALPASFLGGLVALDGGIYYAVTGCILLFAAVMMVVRLRPPSATPPAALPAALAGSIAGFVSGVTGVGGGVFLAPAVIMLGWASARQAAALSAPFIFGNSITGLAGALASGQWLADGTALYAVAALARAIVGTAIGQRFMGERATRLVLAAILFAAAIRLLTR